jgi:hypothetical protein
MQALAELERRCGAPPADGWPARAGRAECVVCTTAPRSARLRPCFHALLGAPCAAELVRRGNRCPACHVAVGRYEEEAFDARPDRCTPVPIQFFRQACTHSMPRPCHPRPRVSRRRVGPSHVQHLAWRFGTRHQ